MWIRINLKRKETLFIGLFYGKQGIRNNNVTLDEEFNTIERHPYQYIINNQNHILLLDDLNAKIGNGVQGIRNGDPKITPNGKRLVNLANNLNLKILNRSPKCEGKWKRINTKNENEKFIIDYTLCTQTLYTNINTIIIDEEENYKLNGKSKTDHNSIIIEINKIASTLKMKIDNYHWEINSNTNWTRFRETMQNNIVNNKPRNYEEQEKIIIQTAIEEIGLFKNKNNEVYTNKEIKEAGKLKVKARKK